MIQHEGGKLKITIGVVHMKNHPARNTEQDSLYSFSRTKSECRCMWNHSFADASDILSGLKK